MPEPEQDGLWAELVAVVRGEMRDYTRGSMARNIVLLAIPMVLEMLMQSVFELADAYFVGQLGPAALGAVGAGASLIIIVFAIGFGLAMSVTAMVARRIGEGNSEGASQVAMQSIIAVVAVSIPFAVLGALYAPELLRLIQAPESVVAAGADYTAILFGTNIVILLLFLINGIFRGAGDAMLALKALALANMLNIALDPLLIFGWGPVPAMGVTGAAIATSVGRGIGVTFQLYLLFGGSGRIRLHMRRMRVLWQLMRRFISLSAPAMLQMFIGTASWMLVFAFVGVFGEAATAGYTVAVRVVVFALLPAWGMGNAAATMVGQNLGAQQPAQAERAVWVTSFANMVFLGSVALVMLFYSEPLVLVFSSDPAVVAVGASCLRIVAYSYPLLAFGMVITQAFNGAGDMWTPTWINLICSWLFQLPLAWALAFAADWGVDGVFAAITAGQAMLAGAGVLIFRRGTWKSKVV